jgi:hypothetical protein
MMGRSSIFLTVVGAIVSLVGWLLFFRMATDLNKVLPPNRRIPFYAMRNRVSEIRRLHEDSFPESPLSTAWLILMVVAGAILGTAIVLELARTSK